MSDNTSIAEILGFLREFAPNELGQLRARHSTATAIALLQTGTILGPKDDKSSDAEPAVDQSVALGILRVKCEAALAALDLATQLLPSLVERLVRRSKRANNWEAAGSLLALVGSGSALATLWPAAPDMQRAQWAAALALVGSVSALAPKALRKPFVGTAENVTELLVETQDILARADQLRPLLRHAVQEKAALALSEVQEAIKQAEGLARRGRQLPLEGA